jgi:protein-disulfide isomerase
MYSHKWTSRHFAGSLLWSALLAIPAVCLGAAPPAQQSGSQEDQQVLKLRDDVEQLKAQQQKILDGLNELKTVNGKALAAKPNNLPAVNLPQTLNLAGESFRGDASAQVVIIEYGDFECRFCLRFERLIYPQLRDTYISTGQVRYYFRDLPLPFHPLAMPAARAARCAAEQGQYWPMHDSLYADHGLFEVGDIDKRAATLGLDVAKLDACTASGRFADVIQRSIEEANSVGILGTPTFLIGTVVPGGNEVTVTQTVVGAEQIDAFRSVVDPLLAATKPTARGAQPDTGPKTTAAR